jgi:hypothetical protein
LCAPKRADSVKMKEGILLDKKTWTDFWLGPQPVLSLTGLKESNRDRDCEASSALFSVQRYSCSLCSYGETPGTMVPLWVRCVVQNFKPSTCKTQLTRDVHCDAVGEASWRCAREHAGVLGLRVIHRQPVLPLAFLRRYRPPYTHNYTLTYTTKTQQKVQTCTSSNLDFRLPPLCSWDLRYSGILCGVVW